MTLAVLTFTFTLTTVLVSYWAFVLRPEARMTAQLRSRLQLKSAAPAASLLKPGGLDLASDASSRWYVRRLVRPASALLDRAGVRLSPARLVGGTVLAT